MSLIPNDLNLAKKNLKTRISIAKEMCQKQAERGRSDGTYWHYELARLEQAYKNLNQLEVKDHGKQNMEKSATLD